jgi:hypothetical protein
MHDLNGDPHLVAFGCSVEPVADERPSPETIRKRSRKQDAPRASPALTRSADI